MDERVLSKDQIDRILHGLNEWQWWDAEVQAAYPWFTYPFIQELKTWDLKNKTVLEYGGGRGTKWWRSKCKYVTTIETSKEWAEVIEEDCKELTNGHTVIVDHDNIQDYVVCARHNIIIIDGEHRKECLLQWKDAKGITLIADNWDQAHVWIGDGSVQLMKDKKGNIFEQPDHQGENGRNKWKTIYWNL